MTKLKLRAVAGSCRAVMASLRSNTTEYNHQQGNKGSSWFSLEND